ncbi:hypothetical protein JCM5296_005059 [Sporobolomyces johnsonii]
MTDTASNSPPANPHLTTPLLHVDGLVSSVTDEELVEVLNECLKLRLSIDRDGSSAYAPATGTIEFESLSNAEKAYATCNNQQFPHHSCALSLHLNAPPAVDPQPLARPRLLKSLPRTFTSGQLFDLCRPFGPIYSATLQLAPSYPPGSGPPKFKGHALVTFYEEKDAQAATEGLHFLEVGGQNIAVALWDAKRAEKGRRSDVSARSVHQGAMASPVQSQHERTSQWAATTNQAVTPGRSGAYPNSLSAGAPEWSPSAAMQRNVSGASQTSMWSSTDGPTLGGSPVQPASQRMPSSAAVIDPCNLFIKSLDPSISSQDLYNEFHAFGEIVSARVMRDERTGRSKEFGFVSYREPEQAALALRTMDGKRVKEKFITVRLHEPKKLREGRRTSYVEVPTAVSPAGSAYEGTANGAAAKDGSASVHEVEQGMAKLMAPPSQRSPKPTHATLPSSVVAGGVAVPGSPDSPQQPLAAAPPAGPPSPSSAPASERDRLMAEVEKLEPQRCQEIVELIEGLPKKERVMCLFNPAVLKQKVQDALLILDAEDEPVANDAASATKPAASPTPAASTPSASSSASVPASIPLLAALPALEIIPLLPSATPALALSTPPADELKATNAFMDELEGLPVAQVKQKLGERLFKVVKATGIKRAPKITIDLLDSEDLRSLAQLMHYPELLKEKALSVSGSS